MLKLFFILETIVPLPHQIFMNPQAGFELKSCPLGFVVLLCRFKQISSENILTIFVRINFNIDFSESLASIFKLNKANNGEFVFNFTEVEKELYFIGSLVELEDVAGEIEYQVEEISHVVCKHIIGNLATLLKVFVKNPDCYLHACI